MGEVAKECGAVFETVVFLKHFRELPDHRQAGKVTYPLDEVLLLCLLAVLAGADTFVDIARFGTRKIDLMRRFRPFRDGTPSHDHLGDILATLDADQFQRCFVAWVASLTGAPEGVIAIDGKTLRRSHHGKGGKAAIHMVSAFAARQRLVLGQVKVAEKSNEIVAIPKLLDLMAIEGAIVTIDAMGCQRDIAQKVIDKKADYVLALKGNQGSLRDDVHLFCAEQKANGFADAEISRAETVDGDHGRIETRTTTVIQDVEWLRQRHKWPGLNGVVIVESARQIDGAITSETRVYITSLRLPAYPYGQKTDPTDAPSRRLTMIVAQEPTQSLAAPHGSLALLIRVPRKQQDVALPLVVPLGMEMIDIIAQRPPQRALAEQDHLRQALLLDRSDPALRVGIQVRAACRQRQRLNPT